MPKLMVVERDYPAFADRMAALGPLSEKLGLITKGVKFNPDVEVADLESTWRNALLRSLKAEALVSS